jgi:hypothetical protein
MCVIGVVFALVEKLLVEGVVPSIVLVRAGGDVYGLWWDENGARVGGKKVGEDDHTEGEIIGRFVL